MTTADKPVEIRMIPVDKIDVLNPRDRNAKAFNVIVGNIKNVGLKKPIKVTPRTNEAGEERYLLVFGEGRLTAFRNLGEKEIPAMVVDISDEDAFLMSLVENVARRQERPLENLASIGRLRAKGDSPREIATKTGLTAHYVQGMLTLLEQGEERLLVAVERGHIPLNAALTIHGAGNDDKAIQAALQDAYESGQLRGKPLMEVRRIIERRRTLGRSVSKGTPRKRGETSAASLVRTYQLEVDRQRKMVKKAEFTQHCLIFVAGALRELLADENFVNLLRAEGLETLPKYLAERIWSGGGPA